MFLARLGEITCRKLGIIACFTSMKQGLLILVMLLDTGKTYPSDFISAMSCPLKDFTGNFGRASHWYRGGHRFESR